jgi:signal transduction histidine kinase
MDRPLSTFELLWEWLSNELRNPLAPIVSAMDVLCRSRPNETELNGRWLEILHEQSARLVQLADDLLDLSRACEETLRVEHRELESQSLLSSARDELDRAIRSHIEAKLFLTPFLNSQASGKS